MFTDGKCDCVNIYIITLQNCSFVFTGGTCDLCIRNAVGRFAVTNMATNGTLKMLGKQLKDNMCLSTILCRGRKQNSNITTTATSTTTNTILE